jgi:cell division protein FtsL
MSNRLRTPQNEPEKNVREEKSEKAFSGNIFEELNASSLKLVPFVIFFVITGVIYIANRHYTHRKVREITQLRNKVEELRVNYTTLKAEVMAEKQQAEVAKRVKKLGIVEPEKNKILIRKK